MWALPGCHLLLSYMLHYVQGQNKLSGGLPSSMHLMTSLMTLRLPDNSLTGQTLRQC